jgi:hypothetical protein
MCGQTHCHRSTIPVTSQTVKKAAYDFQVAADGASYFPDPFNFTYYEIVENVFCIHLMITIVSPNPL